MKNMIKIGNYVFKNYIIDYVAYKEESHIMEMYTDNEITKKHCLTVFLNNKPCSVRIEFATEKEALDCLKEISEL